MSLFGCCRSGGEEPPLPPEPIVPGEEWKLLLVRRVYLENTLEDDLRGIPARRQIREEVLVASRNGLTDRITGVMERAVLKAAFPLELDVFPELEAAQQRISQSQDLDLEHDEKRVVAIGYGDRRLQLSTSGLWSGRLLDDPMLEALRERSETIATLFERLAEYHQLEELSKSELKELCRERYETAPSWFATKKGVLKSIREQIENKLWVEGTSYLDQPLPHLREESSSSSTSS